MTQLIPFDCWLSGEGAAALAAAAVAFQASDPAYALALTTKAKALYALAKNNPGSFMTSTTSGLQDLAKLYPSTGYHDELGWAALWLFQATNSTSYLTDATGLFAAVQGDANSGGGFQVSHHWPMGLHTDLAMLHASCGICPRKSTSKDVMSALWVAEPLLRQRSSMRLGDTVEVLAKCKLKYYRISECAPARHSTMCPASRHVILVLLQKYVAQHRKSCCCRAAWHLQEAVARHKSHQMQCDSLLPVVHH